MHREASFGSSQSSAVPTFFFINCGARGPFYRQESSPGGPTKFVSEYVHLFKRKRVRLAGASISCERGPHVQSWFFALDKVGVEIATEQWSMCPWKSWDLAIENGEVGLSRAVLSRGFEIAAIVPEFNPVFPGSCKYLGNPGLLRQDLDTQMFVKHGGEMMKSGLLNGETMKEVEQRG